MWHAHWIKTSSQSEIPTSVEETLHSPSLIIYLQLKRFFQLLATLPVTTCTCERSISVLRRVKTYLRSTTREARCSNLCLIHSASSSDALYDMDEIIDLFAKDGNHPQRQSNLLRRAERGFSVHRGNLFKLHSLCSFAAGHQFRDSDCAE